MTQCVQKGIPEQKGERKKKGHQGKGRGTGIKYKL